MPPEIGNLTHSESVTLKEYVESRFTSIEEAIKVALVAMDKRLDSMNEIRETMRDQASKFPTRAELEIQLSNIGKDVRELQNSRSYLAGRASQSSVNLALLISIIGIILGIVALFVK